MHVHFRRFQLVVPQQLFYDFQVRALLDQMRGERVSQQVGVHPLGDSGFLRRLFQLLRHDALRERFALVPLEQPFLRLVQLGVLGQLPDKGLRQQRVAVFPPFALPYPYQRTAHVDVVGLQVQQLADSQPGGVEQREHAEQPDVRTGCVKDGFYLLLAQHVGQRPFPFGSLYLVTFPFLSQHLLEIKLDRVDAQVLLARRDPPCVNQVYDVGVDFFRSDVAKVSSRKVLLELPEIDSVRTDGMLAVPQLPQRLGIAGRDGGAGFPALLGQGVFQGGVIDIRRFHMAVEKAGQVEAFFRQVGSVPLEPHALLFRQRQPDGIVLVELHFHVFLPVTDGR